MKLSTKGFDINLGKESILKGGLTLIAAKISTRVYRTPTNSKPNSKEIRTYIYSLFVNLGKFGVSGIKPRQGVAINLEDAKFIKIMSFIPVSTNAAFERLYANNQLWPKLVVLLQNQLSLSEYQTEINNALQDIHLEAKFDFRNPRIFGVQKLHWSGNHLMTCQEEEINYLKAKGILTGPQPRLSR